MWPLALVAIVREPPNATEWSRLHARQSCLFGLAGIAAYLILLALPLLIVLLIPDVSTGAVVWLYAIGLLADAAAAVALLAVALRYRARALRGELFTIPLVTAVADRFLRFERG